MFICGRIIIGLMIHTVNVAYAGSSPVDHPKLMRGYSMYDKETSKYMLKHPTEFEFYSSIDYRGDALSIPVIFGAKQWESLEEAQEFRNSKPVLKNFIVVERYTHVTIINAEE